MTMTDHDRIIEHESILNHPSLGLVNAVADVKADVAEVKGDVKDIKSRLDAHFTSEEKRSKDGVTIPWKQLPAIAVAAVGIGGVVAGFVLRLMERLP